MSDKLYASSGAGREVLPFLSKLESLAGSAVRAAGKVAADLIVVYTATGECKTAQSHNATECRALLPTSWHSVFVGQS